jgi:hypothetical protein
LVFIVWVPVWRATWRTGFFLFCKNGMGRVVPQHLTGFRPSHVNIISAWPWMSMGFRMCWWMQLRIWFLSQPIDFCCCWLL